MSAEGPGDTAGRKGEAVAPDDWASWSETATNSNAGREIDLRFEDAALGEVRLADGQPFVAIEHDRLGPSVALTVKYGDGVVPVRYVIADPREVRQQLDVDGALGHVSIVDGTGRRVYLSLA